MKSQTGSNKINLMIGGNVTEKLTPETYEKMNKEFEEDDLSFRIVVPTQEEIDKWVEDSKSAPHPEEPDRVDLVTEMWKDYNAKKKLEENQQ